MFNLTSNIVFLKAGKELTDDISAVIKEYADDIESFFSKIGFNTSESPLDSKELTNGNAHYGYSFPYFINKNKYLDNKVNENTVRLWLTVANNSFSNVQWNTHNSNLKKDKPSAFKPEILAPITEYLAGITSINPNLLNGNVVSHLIYATNCLLVRLWRKKAILLPIGSKLKMSRAANNIFSLKANNRGKKAPLYKASSKKISSLSLEFPQIAFALNSACKTEKVILEGIDSAFPITGPIFILYTSTWYNKNDCKYNDLEECHKQWGLLYGKTFNLINSKQVTRDEHILLTVKKPFDGFKKSYERFKEVLVSSLSTWKGDEAVSIAKKWTNELKKEYARLQHGLEDIDYILKTQSEEDLFIYCLNIPVTTKNLDNLRTFIPDKITIDLTQWTEYFRIWKSTSKTSSRGKSSAISLLVKYLIYVAMWQKMFVEQSNKAAINFPVYFKDLDRETFVIRSETNKELDNETWPRTLAEFAIENNATSCSQLRLFLNEIEHIYRLDEKHVLPTLSLLKTNEFTSHWHAKMTGVRVGSSTKLTPKNIITRKAFPILLNAFYTLESYGMYLQEQRLQDIGYEELGLYPDTKITGAGKNYSQPNLLQFGRAFYLDKKNNQIINIEYSSSQKALPDEVKNTIDLCNKRKLDACGYTPLIWFQNEKLEWEYFALTPKTGYFPQLFPLGDIEVKMSDNSPVKKLNMPLLGILRGHIVAIEQGLRHIHIRWLDAQRYNLKSDHVTEHGLTKLLISSDKTKKNEWLQHTHISVIELLNREKDFRNKRTDISINKQFRYKDEKHGQFITPLFLNHAGKVFNELSWSAKWTDSMSICNTILRCILKDDFSPLKDSLIRYVPIASNNKINYSDKSYSALRLTPEHPLVIAGRKSRQEPLWDADCTRVRIAAIVTPHGTRNTWITHRVGIMPLHHICHEVGHSSLITTAHYHKVTDDDLDAYHLRYKNSLAVKPSEASSNVKTAFEKDRKEAAYLYGFTSIPLNITAEEDENKEEKNWTGIDIIETVNANQVVFADTHICPFSMVCPAEIAEENGGQQKCGLCRAKIVHIDNLPSIEHIQDKLILDVYTKVQKIIKLNASKTDNKEQVERLRLDITSLEDELVGWEISSNALENIRQILIKQNEISGSNSDDNLRKKGFYCPAPAMLDSTIVRSEKRDAIYELAMKHMMSHEDFPALSSDALLPVARRVGNQLITQLAQHNPQTSNELFSDLALETDSDEVIRKAVTVVRTMIAANIISADEVIKHIAPTILEKNTTPKSQFKLTLENSLQQIKRLNHAS
ncbi:hypothetical protein ACR30L_16120 [Psychromonas sp. PT13]|uniref:hypothetical protein n=1 Tax=Psychromonas sp. PT13 TaxID=3439547 RepID=UPI003EBCD26B